jgi:DNA-binding protein BldD-like, C-terminal domain
MKRLRWLLVGAGVAGGAAVVLLRLRRSTRPGFPVAGAPTVSPNGLDGRNRNGHPVERRSRSDPESLQALVDGTASRVGLDLGRLNELKSVNYKPLMEYLGYIQVQRGESETLLFVRMKDLDEMADLAGQSRDELLKQFKKLGVLLSMN